MNNSKKKFFAAAATYIVGKSTGVKIQGSQNRIQATREILHVSKALYEALHKSDVRIEDISALLELKHTKAQKFKKETGLHWVL